MRRSAIVVPFVLVLFRVSTSVDGFQKARLNGAHLSRAGAALKRRARGWFGEQEIATASSDTVAQGMADMLKSRYARLAEIALRVHGALRFVRVSLRPF